MDARSQIRSNRRRARAPWLPGAALALVAAASGCTPGGGAEGAPETAAAADGHHRMLAELARIEAGERVDNPFLGEARARELREQLAALPPDVPDLRRWFFNLRLGREELRLGNEQQALEHYRRARELLARWGGEIPPEQQLRTVFELAVANLRWAETLNCVADHVPESCLFPLRGGGVHVRREGAETAARLLVEVLEAAPPGSLEAVRSRWLLNLAHMALGTWPRGVPERWRIPEATFASDEPFPAFPEVAGRLGLAPFDLAGGAAVEDYDGDGLLDVVVSTSDTAGGMHYYRNAGDGTFVERTAEAGLEGLLGGLNMEQADYDGDGDVDLLVLRGAWWRERGRHPNSLLRNDGTGRFTDVTYEAGLAEPAWPTQTAAWADYDLDGDLDLYVGNEADSDLPAPGQLFDNGGDGTFTDVAARAGVENLRYAKGVAWGDYDGDGRPDLYVSNLGAPNRLYRNLGDGTFTDVASELGVEGPLASFPTWFWDPDNDGDLDLFVAAYGGPNVPPDVADVAASVLGLTPRAERARLYLNDGRGGFEPAGPERGFAGITLPMGANHGDIDNDGWPEVYLGTGYPYYEGLMPNVMYRNREGRGFADVTTAGGFGHLQKGHGVVFADLDNDGDVDVYEQIGGQYPGDAFANALFVNPGFAGTHWLRLRLVGRRSDPSAVGAVLRAEIDDGGRRRSVYGRVGTGGSFGANPLRVELGLGAATTVERLTIRWPAGGEQVLAGVPVDRLLRIVEGEDGWTEPPFPRVDLQAR